MQILVSFLVLNGMIVTYKEGSDPNTTGTYFSDNLRSCTSNGWKVKIERAGHSRKGRIICEYEFTRNGDLLTKHQEFPLENGTLIIGLPENWDSNIYALEYDDFTFAQWAYFFPTAESKRPEVQQLAQELEQALDQDDESPDYTDRFINSLRTSWTH